MSNVPIKSVLGAIEDHSEFFFMYEAHNVDVEKSVSISAVNKTVPELLNELFANTDITYKINNRQIALSAESLSAVGQQFIKVSGKVTDSSGNTLPGVSIVLKGTTKGAITDSDGNFTLPNVASDATLVFSFVGMKTQEMKVAGKTSIDITMEEEAFGLDEVVAIGYGTSRKKDLTGSISSIKMENSALETLPNVNLLDALKGSMPGFDIGVVTAAGSNPSINIRGQNSIRASNTPLVVLDGVVFTGSLNEINPMDIASVDVLKDASSTAIYGSLAANGVMLITTKRGKTDKPIVQMNVTGGIQTYTNRPDMLSPDGYIQLKKDRFQADNPGGTYDINTNLATYELDAYNANHTVDWFNEVTRLSLIHI